MDADTTHLALVLSGLSGGGAQRRMVTLANAFARRGHRVDLVAVHPGGPFRVGLSPAVRLVGLDPWWTRLPGLARRKGARVLASAPALAAYLRRERPEAVLASSNPANIATLWARQLAGVPTPVVVSVNVHVSSAAASRRRPFLGHLVRRSYPTADGIIAVSASVARDLVRVTGLAPERVTTIHNPVATAEIERQAQVDLDHPWFASGEPPVVLGAGKLKPQKDFATLVTAFARVRATHPTRVVILGEGEERARLLRVAQRLGVADGVALPGFVANPFAYMARAAVFVLSSAWEGFSNVLAEALACSCPVVSTNCPGGPAELLDDGVYGPLVPVGDADALAAAIVHVLRRPPDRERLRARARAFSVERAAEEYLRVLLACAERLRCAAGGVGPPRSSGPHPGNHTWALGGGPCRPA